MTALLKSLFAKLVAALTPSAQNPFSDLESYVADCTSIQELESREREWMHQNYGPRTFFGSTN